MAELDKSGVVSWAFPTENTDAEIDKDMAELESHTELIKEYGQLRLDISAIIGNAIKVHGLEGLTFWTKAFKILIFKGVEVLKENAQNGK